MDGERKRDQIAEVNVKIVPVTIAECCDQWTFFFAKGASKEAPWSAIRGATAVVRCIYVHDDIRIRKIPETVEQHSVKVALVQDG